MHTARDDENSTEAIDLRLTDDERTNLECAASLQQKIGQRFVIETVLCTARAMLSEAAGGAKSGVAKPIYFAKHQSFTDLIF